MTQTVYSDGIIGGTNGSFSATISSLAPGTTYYYKAFMTVWNGTKYVDIESPNVGTFRTSEKSSSGIWAWMELPAMSSSAGADFYAHDLSGAAYENKAKSGHRNWSCYWSKAHKVSYWVAYPMFSELNVNTVSRKDAFGYDPIVPQSEQPNINGGTYGNDSRGTAYSRGHQIPSSDRLSSSAANKTTFYATNMTPQIQSFNGGIWLALENKVKTWANASDTLYVVTGCVVDGSTRTVADNVGRGTITVPTQYYKALLRVKNGSYSGRAFIFDHFGSYDSGKLESYVISIDELENQTGIDFFPNLISKIGAAAASRIEASAANW